MHPAIIHDLEYFPKPIHEGPLTLPRFQYYLAKYGRPWSLSDDALWQTMHARVHPAEQESMLHGWIVNALNCGHIPLSMVAAWLMQYPAGQIVVASRWPQAPHLALGLLYPEWSKMQNMKAALGLPWYNGMA